MSHSSPGRHRAAEPARRLPRGVGTGVLIALLVIGIGLLAYWLSLGDPEPAADPEPSASRPQTSTPVESPVPAARVESDRTVTIDGTVVTVEETSAVVDGGAVRAMPPTSAPVGLELLSATVESADGRSTDFDAPLKLQPSGSLTVVGRYRLTDCPDLLPTQWPSPSDFPDATRTYPRLQEPLHTAYAICPSEPSKAKPLDGLSGAMVDGVAPTIKLKWAGSSPLTIATIGAASGVAALVVEPGCNGACAAQVDPGGETTITLQPVDPCPPATTDDILTLKLEGGDLVTVDVADLHQAVCS